MFALSTPAWFAHAPRELPPGRAHLGVAVPLAAGDIRFFDLGAEHPVASLERGALDGDDLQRRLQDAPTLEDPPTFLVPIERPSKILCLGKNFAAHAAEFGAQVPDEPLFFNKLVDTLLAHDGDVEIPAWLETRVDHEAELCVVIGRDGESGALAHKNVPRERALRLVAGYTIFDDVTARRMQGDDRKQQKPWLRCKSFDTFGPIGPWVVPADRIDPADLGIELRVNGALRQSSRTALMVVGIDEAIAYLSRHTTLRCGDLIAMGTPEGVGPIVPGDRVEVAIEGIGTLRHGVRREATRVDA